MKSNPYEMIVCVVNAGFAVEAMETAKKAGAKGGTIVRARGTANPAAEEFYDIAIQPDKEMLWIVVPKEIKDDILHRLYQDVGLNTPGGGIAISLPVSNAIGLHED